MNKVTLTLANKKLTSFRRAGITVGHQPVVIEMPPLTEAQLKQLQAEPNIKVVVEPVEPAAPPVEPVAPPIEPIAPPIEPVAPPVKPVAPKVR